MTDLILALYPLQVRARDITFGKPGGNTSDALLVLVIIAAIVAAIIIANAVKKGPGGISSVTGTRSFSVFALRRLAKSIGLNHEQTKMLELVFRIDEVTDPEKSIATPSLLDRHFRRAYRVIEQTSNTEQEAQRKLAILFSTRNVLENSTIGGITSTRQLKDETVLTLNNGKDKTNVTVLSTKTDYINVETPINALGSQLKIPKGTRLSVIFFTKNNKCFSFETRVIGYSTLHGHPAMQLAHSNYLKFLSARRFRRKQAAIACFMYLVYVEGTGRKQRLVVDKRRIGGTIADISVGGCSIKTTTSINVGARFKIEYTQGDHSVAALGQVLRTNRMGINTIAHIRFLRVSQRSMNLINGYVYEYMHD